jgi:ferritin
MIGERMQKLMNEQIKHEIGSAYLYLSMAAYFDSINMDGMAGWMRSQAQEEMVHAMKFFNHIKDRGGRVWLMGLEQPKTEWSSPLNVFQEAHKHEQFITSKIHALTKLAYEESDYTALPLLNWFNEEQIEEEDQTIKIVQMLEKIKDSSGSMIMLDRELGERKFKYPS